jgi:hypothetical protein
MPLDQPSRIHTNIVPENNLRLPDALTIKHGPAPLLARFVREADKEARRGGIQMRLRHDFDELLYVNKRQIKEGNWYTLPFMFNPEYCELTPENSYWIAGEDEHGEMVMTQAGRVYDWPTTTLEDELRLMFFGGRDFGQVCRVTTDAARSITGVVFYGGALWLRPDFRKRLLAGLPGRVGRAYAAARWPVDWAISFMAPALAAKGHAARCGYQHTDYGVQFPGSPWGDLDFVLTSLSIDEAYVDFANFLETELASDRISPPGYPVPSTLAEHRVTKTSSDGVFQGNSSLSYRTVRVGRPGSSSWRSGALTRSYSGLPEAATDL